MIMTIVVVTLTMLGDVVEMVVVVFGGPFLAYFMSKQNACVFQHRSAQTCVRAVTLR